jgi:hypothetical protein
VIGQIVRFDISVMIRVEGMSIGTIGNTFVIHHHIRVRTHNCICLVGNSACIADPIVAFNINLIIVDTSNTEI